MWNSVFQMTVAAKEIFLSKPRQKWLMTLVQKCYLYSNYAIKQQHYRKWIALQFLICVLFCWHWLWILCRHSIKDVNNLLLMTTLCDVLFNDVQTALKALITHQLKLCVRLVKSVNNINCVTHYSVTITPEWERTHSSVFKKWGSAQRRLNYCIPSY